jgi:hypothetical protein
VPVTRRDGIGDPLRKNMYMRNGQTIASKSHRARHEEEYVNNLQVPPSKLEQKKY